MSEFHTAFYRTCTTHKDTEYPMWRKCPKCSKVIIYTEEEVKEIVTRAYNYGASQMGYYLTHKIPAVSTINRWFETNKKK